MGLNFFPYKYFDGSIPLGKIRAFEEFLYSHGEYESYYNMLENNYDDMIDGHKIVNVIMAISNWLYYPDDKFEKFKEMNNQWVIICKNINNIEDCDFIKKV